MTTVAVQIFLSLACFREIFAQWHSSGTGLTIIYLEGEKPPMTVPAVQTVAPKAFLFGAHKFYYQKKKINYDTFKATSYQQMKLDSGTDEFYDDNKFLGNIIASSSSPSDEVPEVLQYLLGASGPSKDRFHSEEPKPVYEHIKGDVNYDFRTKTHTYENIY